MRFSAFVVTLVAILISPAAHAQQYPERPVHLIEPIEAGGSHDPLIFMIGDGILADLGQPGVVDFRAGGGGIIGVDFVAKSKPDGYTLLIGNSGPIAILPNLKKLPYDVENDFVPVGPMASYPFALIVNPKLGFKTVADLVDYAKKNPGKLKFATNGVGQATHLLTELLKIETGINIAIVPYKGTPMAINDVIAGNVDAMFPNAPAVLPLMSANKFQMLAITSTARSPYAPDVPTMAESGLPKVEAMSWIGVFAPAKTPAAIVSKLEAQVAKVMHSPAALNSLKQISSGPMTGSAQEFGKFVAQERAKWNDVIKKANVTID